MDWFLDSILNSVSLLCLLGCLALVFASELLNRSGRNKAQAKVLPDLESRTKLWDDMKIEKQDFNNHIARLQSTSSGGSLAAGHTHKHAADDTATARLAATRLAPASCGSTACSRATARLRPI
jgi:hypothetical protein